MLSRGAYIACLLLIAYAAVVLHPKWKTTGSESIFGWDAGTYYWYLPATFIYKDLKQQKFGDSIIDKYRFTPDFSQSYVHPSGNRVITYSSGIALISLPPFIIAHVATKFLPYPSDGFSKPYQLAVQLWGLLAGIIGLWYFRRLLLLFFSDGVAAATLIALVFGTNYLNYAAIDVTLTHSYLFTIYVLLLINTHHFYVEQKYKYAVRIGLLIGLAILVRPSEIVALVIPLLWGMNNFSLRSCKEQVLFFQKNKKYVAAAMTCAVLVCSVQVVYWYYVTGSLFVYSYDDKTFSWLAPHTWKYLTSYGSGWLMYNPMILFVFLGLVPLMKHGANKAAIILFFVLSLYVVSAWDIWWYSGIGGRAMIQSYAVIFLPIGMFFQYAFRNKLMRWITTILGLLFIYVNIWVIYNAHAANGLYDTTSMSRQYYWAVIGKWDVDNEVLKLKDAREIYTGDLLDVDTVYVNRFDDTAAYQNKRLTVSAGSNTPVFSFEVHDKHKDWLRISANYSTSLPEWDVWKMMRTRVQFYYEGEEVIGEGFKPQRFLRDSLNGTIYYDMHIPENTFDKVQICFLNDIGNFDMQIDNLHVLSYNSDR